MTRQGKRYEVDALIMTSSGLYLVEIKSHPGRIEGDANTLYWTPEPDKKPHRQLSMDHPLSLASRKAKAIKDLLDRSEEFRRAKKRAPFVSEVIFLSAPDLVVRLTQQGKFNVYGRDAESGEELPAGRRSIGGIVEAITTSSLTAMVVGSAGSIAPWLTASVVRSPKLGFASGLSGEPLAIGVSVNCLTTSMKIVIRVSPTRTLWRLMLRPTTSSDGSVSTPTSTILMRMSARLRFAARRNALLNKLTVDGVLRPFDFTETERVRRWCSSTTRTPSRCIVGSRTAK